MECEHRWALALGVTVLMAVCGRAHAQSPADTGTEPESGTGTGTGTGTGQESLAAADTAAEPDAAAFSVSGEPGKGVTFEVGDAFSLNLRARLQLRYQLDIPAEDALVRSRERELSHSASIGAARIWLSGHAYWPELTYLIQLAFAGRDFRDGSISPIYDAYLDWAPHRDFNVRAGQFFVPFDRLRTVRDWAQQMADRPWPVSELTLDRDVGVSFYSNNFLADDSPFAWRLSAFGGSGINLANGKTPGALLVARLELRPLGEIDDDIEGDVDRRAEPGLAVGVAFAVNVNSNRLRSTTGPTFAGGTTDYLHAATDLAFKWGGFALLTEYLWKAASRDAILSVDDVGMPVTEYTRSGHGFVLQASYAFDPPFEVVGRLSSLWAFGGTDPAFVSEVDARGQEVAAGVNYYVNGHRFKIQADWIARMPSDFDISVATHAVHIQLDATF